MKILKRICALALVLIMLVGTFSCTVECLTCFGKQKIMCRACSGSGDSYCGICGGDGKNTCSLCFGSGRRACSFCGGAGSRLEYDFFKKTYVTKDCISCSAGRVSCQPYTVCSCIDGKRNCSSCGGDGKILCPDCTQKDHED